MSTAQIVDRDARLSPPAAARLGSLMAIVLALVTAIAFALGIATPPRSGPFCTGTCIAYPYTDAAQFVPRDYFWMIPGIAMLPLFVVVACCMTSCIEERKRHLGLVGTCLASISAAILTADYFIQLQAVAPSLAHGESDGLTLFSQYNPHGIFIALEDLGYLTLSFAFLFAGLAFPKGRALRRAVRWTYLISFLFSILTFIGMAWRFGLDIEYRFEVAIITIVWTTLIVVGVLLSIYFRRARDPEFPA